MADADKLLSLARACASVLVLLGTPACRPQVDIEPVAVAVDLDVLTTRLHAELADARTHLLDGQRQAAADSIRACYQGSFSDLEPILKAYDPQATLELEYRFGQVAVVAAARRATDAPQRLDALIAAVDSALADLPAPTEAQGQPLKQPAATGGVSIVPDH